MPYKGGPPHLGLPSDRQVGRMIRRLTRGRTIGWTLSGLLLGVLLGFATELLRRQPAAKVQQRYVAPPAAQTTEATATAPGAEPARMG